MFVGTVSSSSVMQLSWMTTTSGLAVVAVTEIGIIVAGFSEALRPGKSAYSVVPSGMLDLSSCVKWASMESWHHV